MNEPHTKILHNLYIHTSKGGGLARARPQVPVEARSLFPVLIIIGTFYLLPCSFLFKGWGCYQYRVNKWSISPEFRGRRISSFRYSQYFQSAIRYRGITSIRVTSWWLLKRVTRRILRGQSRTVFWRVLCRTHYLEPKIHLPKNTGSQANTWSCLYGLHEKILEADIETYIMTHLGKFTKNMLK